MADSSTVDWGQVTSQLQQKAGANYNDSMLGDVQRNVSYGQGNNVDPNSLQDWINRVANKANLANTNQSGSIYVANGQGGYTVGANGQVNNNPNPYPTIAGGGLPGANGGTQTSSIAASAPTSGASATPGNPATNYDPTNPPQTAQQNQNTQNSNALFNALMGQATQSLNIDPNDPVIRAQMDAASAQGTRALRNWQSDQAEAAGPYANTSSQNRLMAEQLGQNLSGLQGSLMANELQSRRNQIMQAMQTGSGLLNSNQQTALQQELGLINANLGQQQINTGASEFASNYGLNATNNANYWDSLRSGLITG